VAGTTHVNFQEDARPSNSMFFLLPSLAAAVSVLPCHQNRHAGQFGNTGNVTIVSETEDHGMFVRPLPGDCILTRSIWSVWISI
jgi:hypothetical protein